MATTIAGPPVVRAWSKHARAFAWVLLGCWLVLTALMVFTAPREATLAELRSAVASGEVDKIQVAGGVPTGPGYHGFAELRLGWREGLIRHEVVVREASPVDAEARDTDLEVVSAGLVGRITAEYPDLHVERTSDDYPTGLVVEAFGRENTGLVAWGGLTLTLATLGLLIQGAEPSRATRWAWFWLFGLVPPLSFLGYLALGGPTGLFGAPRPGPGRLTGGWAFLLVVLFNAVLSAAVTAFI